MYDFEWIRAELIGDSKPFQDLRSKKSDFVSIKDRICLLLPKSRNSGALCQC